MGNAKDIVKSEQTRITGKNIYYYFGQGQTEYGGRWHSDICYKTYKGIIEGSYKT